MMDRTEKIETKIIHTGRDPESFGGSVNPPVYHFSTVLYKSVDELVSRYDKITPDSRVMTYGTKGSPTSFSLEDAVAELEGGFRSISFPSGLAAVAGALFAFLKSGDHLLMTDSVYYPTREFCASVLKRFGVETTYYPPCIGSEIEELIQENTTVIYTESPGSHTFEVQDIPALSAVAHRHQAKLIMDNTWASPIFFNPFVHGADVSIQAATKYINGHSDIMLGMVTTTREDWEQLRNCTWHLGQCCGPDDLYMAQRGLRTLSVRMKQHQSNGIQVAEWLKKRPEVRRVLHPALPDDPGHELWKRDFKGASGLFGIELEPTNPSNVEAMLNRLELFGMGFSWGGYESLIVPSDVEKDRLPESWTFKGPLLRLHIGLEDPEDLILDLEQGFQELRTDAPKSSKS